MPPKVQYSCVDGSGPNVSWWSCSAWLRRRSRTRPSRGAALRVGPPELQPMARPRAVAPHLAVLRLEDTVEEQRLHTDVVVEVLEMAEVRHGAERVGADLRRAVSGNIDAIPNC